MTKSAGTAPESNDDVTSSWGTREDLLLAFAVNRHGTGAWDSIATELQKRSPGPSVTLTAQSCRLKYLDLRRRFVGNNDDLEDAGFRDDKSNDEDSVPFLAELRKLRVAELRRELQRYDLNIESLELKKKRMEEEREKREPDLEKGGNEPESEPARGGEPVAHEESEKDQISVNESNSSDLGVEKAGTGEKENEPARTGRTVVELTELENCPDKKSIREDSCNGSSNSIEKEPDRKTKAAAVSGSAELVGSEAESKDGAAEAVKDNSDVQSSASRSMEEKEGSDKVRRGITSGDEREHEDQSRAVKELPAESQRLIDFLAAIRAHKFGSMFERRLRSQESSKYEKLILQHVDLETIETRLKQGLYSSFKTKFFRDLLLLVNNALVFFNKNSSEAKAAIEVRSLISKEMSQTSTKSDSSSVKQASLQSLSIPRKDEPDLIKPRIPGPITVCRKRSSIAAKASTSDKKKEHAPLLAKDEDNSGNSSEPKFTKTRTRDQFSPNSSNSKKNGKTQQKNSGNKSSLVKGGSSSHSESKVENKKNQSIPDSKKRGASNFLNRINKTSSSNNGILADELKNLRLTGESAKRGEKRKQVTRRGLETRQVKEKEKGSPEKKNVGRPPKRGAAAPPPPPPPPPPAAVGKRGRDRGEAESGGSKQPQKRSRKL